jgi:HPt (histidine-containing phosphotransfer) domain-containing protein
MPELTGLEVARAVRSAERAGGGHLPLLALTAQAMSGDRESCLTAGMDVYISKPIEPDVLFAALAGVTDVSARPAFDRARAIAGLDGDEGLFGCIVSEYRQMFPAVTAELDEAVRRRDAHGVVECARRLKGALLPLAADAASAAVRRLEEQGRSGKLDGAEAASAVLRVELVSLGAALAAAV